MLKLTELKEGQQRALDLMLSGENVFLTGEAGTGKSEVVKLFIRMAEEKGKELLITAPTGTAAENLHGETIHRTFGAGIGVQKNSRRLSERKGILRIADTVIIDEISMCRFDLFEYVARRILYENNERKKDRATMERAKITGYIPEEYEEYPVKEKDLQLIVLGDFYQLPPVISDNDKKELSMAYSLDYGQGYAFMSEYWKMMNFKGVTLTEIIRQDDAEFKNALSDVRHGNKKKMDSCINYLMNSSSDFPMIGDNAITMIPTNAKCKEFNDKELSKLDTEERIYCSVSKGEVRESDKFADDEIHLKEGCKVMTTVNAPNGDYVNGTMGIVKRLHDGSAEVLTENGKLLTIGIVSRQITKPVESTRITKKYVDEAVLNDDGAPLKNEKGEVIFRTVLKEVKEKTISHETVGSYAQLPLKIAYAITVHKSQGKTFSKVNIDPYAWDYGQFYTALSRAKKIENICFFQPINPKWIKTSPDVKRFMNGIEKVSKGI